MTNEANDYSFFDFIQEGARCQSELFEVYKSSIGLINDLKNRSRKYMSLLSDIEGGSLGVKSTDDNLKSNVVDLAASIDSFNSEIGVRCDDFSQIFDRMTKAYNGAIGRYDAAKDELSKLIETRKQLIFLRALIRKYKHKINSLQLMNNALLSLSNDLENAKDAYKSNLVQLSTVMTSAVEDADSLIEAIDEKSSSK